MPLINCLEGLTSRKSDGTQWTNVELSELGTYSSLTTHEVWTRSDGLESLFVEDPAVLGLEAPEKLMLTPKDNKITGGIKILVFHEWKDSKAGNDTKAKVIWNAMSQLDLPVWLPAWLYTHSFFSDPSNRSMENSAPNRRYWQRFRGGLPLWSFSVSAHTTRALLLCREEQYWTAFRQSLIQCLNYTALTLLPGVLAYIQQIKVSVSYVYWVRERTNGLLKEVEKNLVIVDTMSGREGRSLREEKLMHDQLALVESHIWELVRCAQEAAGAIPYLTDNSGNLNRVAGSLASVKAENEAYRQAIKGAIPGPLQKSIALANQAEELSALVDDLTIELNSQSLAADWIATKINALIQNTNLTINRADQRLNLLIADSSLTIASESRRDNLSMVTIAAITTLFLPGTFVASFFAMPMLDWSAKPADGVVTARFWIYWAVTIPLTIIVMLCWAAFFWRSDIRRISRVGVRQLASHRAGRKDQSKLSGSVGQHSDLVRTDLAGDQGGISSVIHHGPPKKTPTSEYRMAPNQRIDWSNKGSDIAPMRYAS